MFSLKIKSFIILLINISFGLSILFFSSACTAQKSRSLVDELNEKSYLFHYKDLDSTNYYATKALKLSEGYGAGHAEALNNIAFVSTAKMNYNEAKTQLFEAQKVTDNQIELLISDIMFMRLCQRQSKNKEFYDYKQHAEERLERIKEEEDVLNLHQRKRLLFARTEYYIILSTYFYYIGLNENSIEALQNIDPHGGIQRDTAQLLNYYYSIGSGGIVHKKDNYSAKQEELDYLINCYTIAKKNGFIYWEANALQSISESLSNPETGNTLVMNNSSMLRTIIPDNQFEDLLAKEIAVKSVDLFKKYGDVYQIAGSYRTLAKSFWEQGQYEDALWCLEHALSDNIKIQQAPDLVASIREQMSLAYSAIDDKQLSDYNRNIYLDMQEITRQDRFLESRAEQLSKSSHQLNIMVTSVVIMILLVILLLFIFDRMKRRSDRKFKITSLLSPLEQWEAENKQKLEEFQDTCEDVKEQLYQEQRYVVMNKEKNIEQRAKVSLVSNTYPLIDRMVNEIHKLIINTSESTVIRQQRLAYISELANSINQTNTVLTSWIQMHKGDISLRIESFPLQTIFELLKKNSMSYQLKNINLNVVDTSEVVKADKTLTLFMINTLADNARKFTPSGGEVTISAKSLDDYVEVSIIDNGVGIDEEGLRNLFSFKKIELKQSTSPVQGKGYGFGLMNCKGIIEKYKKVSSIFKNCSIGAESEVGKGSRFYFTLPKGLKKTFLVLFCSILSATSFGASNIDKQEKLFIQKAGEYADSAYYSNLNETYELTLEFADSCIAYLNKAYHTKHPKSNILLKESGDPNKAAELIWFAKHVNTDYDIILDFRNESAVAALALNRWDLYNYNNSVYTQLFRIKSADNTLGDYVKVMQTSESNKNIAIILLILLLVLLIPAYYFLYYRHELYYRFCIDKINRINSILLSDTQNAKEKLRLIETLWSNSFNKEQSNTRLHLLNDIVNKIKHSLKLECTLLEQQNKDLTLLKDELSKTKYEADSLYISNNLLDNSLSTFKHETMYYPSRIKQLIEQEDIEIKVVEELLHYYKELYSLFLLQAVSQLRSKMNVDTSTLKYLFSLIKKINQITILTIEEEPYDDKYVKVYIELPANNLKEKELKQMFTSETIDIRYLICRQIIRELGEETNMRAVGIQAIERNNKQYIEIVFTTVIWKNLKSLL